ncbi:unnamed protein product [Coccothraustes coccothraustes]
MRTDPCRALGVPSRVRVCPCQDAGGSRPGPARSRFRESPRPKGGATGGAGRGKVTSPAPPEAGGAFRGTRVSDGRFNSERCFLLATEMIDRSAANQMPPFSPRSQ